MPLSRFVSVENDVPAPCSQEHYLSLKENTIEFIKFLTTHLSTAGINVINCDDDADSTSAKSAIMSAKKNEGPVLVVSEDTDVAVMLLHHWEDNMSDIFIRQERSRKTCLGVGKAEAGLQGLKENLLFVHAMSGCDTTSFIFEVGKGVFRKN